MAIWRLDKLYFDSLGGSINFDVSNNYFDSVAGSITTGQLVDSVNFSEEINETGLVDTFTFIDEVNFDYSTEIDLMKLIPQKFHTSQLLQDYMYEVGLKVGSWLSKIKDLQDLLDPYKVEEDYIQYLADLIGFILYRNDNITIEELRKQLLFAIPFYKIKGTYKVLSYLSYLNELTLNIWDMYCNSESNYNAGVFSKQAWFVGKYAGENPSGLDSSYFKTSHLGLEVVLNKEYDEDISGEGYLWKEDLFTPFEWWSEKVRPANVVPHFSVFLNPKTSEDGEVNIVEGNIQAKITIDWTYKTLRFDNGLNFDDGNFFDQSYSAFINTITKWKLGTGNKDGFLDVSSFSGLENIVLSGDINITTEYSDRNTFEIVIPKATVQLGISELGLYLNDNTTAVCYSLFPDIDKNSDIELRVLVEIYK